MAKFAVFGDSMLDKYSFYNSNRTSPEAPVPIIINETNEYFLGGAGLVADTLIDLGNDVDLYTMVGVDSSSEIFKSLVSKINIFDFAENNYKLTTKERFIVNKKYFLRKDHDAQESPEIEKVISTFNELIDTYDAVIFVDYNKGFLSKRLFDYLSEISSNKKLLSILDPNINNLQDFKNLDFVKLNLSEAKHFSKKNNLEEIFKDLNKNNLISIITLSSEGAVTQINDKLIFVDAEEIQAIDVSGCGDVFLANFISHFIQSNDIKLSIETSVEKSSKYVSFFGNKKSDN